MMKSKRESFSAHVRGTDGLNDESKAMGDRGDSVRDQRSMYGTGLLRTGMRDQDVLLEDAQDQD